MVYCLLGDSNILKKIFVIKVSPDYVNIFPEDNEKISKLRNILGSNNMFSQSNAVYLRQLDKWKKEEIEELVEFLESTVFPDNTDLFVDGRIKLKRCKKKIFKSPPPWKKEQWLNHINKLSEGLGVEIANEASEKIFETVGANEELIYSELQKLGILERQITENDIEKYSYVYKEKNYNEFAYNLLRGKTDKIPYELIKERSTFPIIIAIITRTVETIGRMKSILTVETTPDWKTITELAKKLKCKTSTVANIVGFRFSGEDENQPNLHKKYSLTDLQNLLLYLQSIDESFKEGRINEFVAFMNLIEYCS
ncbi:MAG: hypothetical protein R6U52_10190 [Kosmotogaceae bacterium]